MADFAETVEPAVASGACRHLAVLVNRPEEVPAVLAAFYALGARRDGWLVHRAMPHRQAEERAALEAAGLDLARLEPDGRLIVHEIDLSQPPEAYGSELEAPLAAALDRGLEAMWYARFAVGTDLLPLDAVLEYDRHYEARFASSPVVTLCPFVVGDAADLAAIAEVHDGIAVLEPGGETVLHRPNG